MTKHAPDTRFGFIGHRPATRVMAAVVCAGVVLLATSPNAEQSPAELPTLVTAYAGVLRHAAQVDLGSPGFEALRPVHEALARIDARAELRARIAAVSDVFVLPKVRGQVLRWLESRSGLSQRESTNTLLVTEPLLALENNGVAIVISSRSPARTTLMSLSRRLEASLIYDSFLTKESAGTAPVGLLSGVGLNPEGDLMLYERDPLGARGVRGRTALLVRSKNGTLILRIPQR